jgi:hypothetical protein
MIWNTKLFAGEVEKTWLSPARQGIYTERRRGALRAPAKRLEARERFGNRCGGRMQCAPTPVPVWRRDASLGRALKNIFPLLGG